MQEFSFPKNETRNILPKDGEVFYFEKIFSTTTANEYFDKLLQQIEWKNDEAFIYGKHIITKRKVAWYAESAFEYRYSKTTKKALSFTNELSQLKKIIEEKTGEQFNSCLLNLYHNGDEGMGWHSDAEKELKQDGAIASLSFGAERTFLFRHKEDKETVSILLENGSLLLMQDTTQNYWLHRMPPTKKVKTPRINLTFRTIVV